MIDLKKTNTKAEFDSIIICTGCGKRSKYGEAEAFGWKSGEKPWTYYCWECVDTINASGNIKE